MKKIEVDLKVKKTEDGGYKVFLNNVEFGCFKFKDYSLKFKEYEILAKSLDSDFSYNELQYHLVKNYLVKDVEDMTNQEFADYLLKEINSDTIHALQIDFPWITCRGEILYRWDSDEINYENWHYGLLRNKFDFCKFNGCGITRSKGNRKRFVNIVKQTIEYLKKFKITEDEEEVKKINEREK